MIYRLKAFKYHLDRLSQLQQNPPNISQSLIEIFSRPHCMFWSLLYWLNIFRVAHFIDYCTTAFYSNLHITYLCQHGISSFT